MSRLLRELDLLIPKDSAIKDVLISKGGLSYKPQRQTVLGIDGNCFSTCVAMILGMDIKDVPHFCAEKDDWWGKFQNWLVGRGMYAIELNQHTSMARVPVGTPAILSGNSKRGLLHSVIAEFSGVTNGDKSEWLFKYDPHPSDQFLESVETVCFIVQVPYSEAACHSCPLKVYAEKLKNEARLHNIAVETIIKRIDEFIEKEEL